MNTSKDPKQTLIEALCRISQPAEMRSALECLLTKKELHEVVNRLLIFEKLDQQLPQREIASSVGVGIVTVTRGARAFKDGKFSVLKTYLQHTENTHK